MGFFKKLFEDSTAQSSNDINSNDKEEHEQQVTNSMSQSVHPQIRNRPHKMTQRSKR